MFNSKDIIDALSNNDLNLVKKITKKNLAEVSLSYINHVKEATAKTSVTEAEEDPPDKEDVQGTEEDPILDPALDREYFLKSFEEGDVLVTIKTIGVGKNKPVSVYLDDVRWEMFPGPVNAEKHAKEFIKSKQYDLWRGRKGLKDIESTGKKDNGVNESINFLEAIDMTVGGKTFTVSIANTPESLQKGLMHEKSMDNNKGILLVFNESARHGIWMKNTHIPLDVLWVSEAGTVVDVQRLEPYDEDIKYPHAPAKYVLEVNAGEYTGKIGDQIEIDRDKHIVEEINEISIQGRRNIAKAAKRTAKRRAVSAKRKKKRRKTKEELLTKARKMARDKIKKKILKGRSENELSFAAREALEKKVNKMKSKIDKIAKKMLAVAKKQESERIKNLKAPAEDNVQQRESVMDVLASVVQNNRPLRIIFENRDSIKVEFDVANAVLTMHEALNKRNQVKLEEMINKNRSGFAKAVEFSIQNLYNNKE